MCEKHIDCLPPDALQLGTWPTTHATTLTGNQISDLSFYRTMLNQMSHTLVSQGQPLLLLYLRSMFPI